MIAIIPARGGSKRVPGKNIMDFMGKPMLAWTIEAAQETGLFSQILVSTDDEKIAEVARQSGAEVPFLRQTAADDIAPVSEATLAALRQLELEQGKNYQTVVQLFAVCPLRTAQEIKDSVEFFFQRKVQFLISCFAYGFMNPYVASTLNENHQPEHLFPDLWAGRKALSDMPKLFAPTGAIWIADVAALKKANTFYGPGHVYWPMDWKSAIDIDTYEDIELAKACFLLKNNPAK